MEWVNTLLNLVSQLSDVAIVVLTFAVIVFAFLFSQTITDLVRQKFNLPRNYNDGRPIVTLADLGGKFGHLELEFLDLKEYVNHRQTEVLQSLIGKADVQIELMQKMIEKIDKHNEMEKENHRKIEEIIEYGVKRRE